MADLDFLSRADLDFLRRADPCKPRDSTITVLLPDSAATRISGVYSGNIISKCPLLAYAFEDNTDGTRQLCIESTSEDAVIRFLRFLYTDDYLTTAEQGNLQTPLLCHVEVYKIALDYDIPVLQLAANSNLLKGTEIACSRPGPPAGLCEAIRFVYQHLKMEQSLIDIIRNYCVSAFRYHGLATNAAFRQVAFDIPEFHQTLCKTNCERDFLDEGASDIVTLSASRPYDGSIALFDMDHRTHAEFHFDDNFDPQLRDVGLTFHNTKRRKTYTGGMFDVVYRPKNSTNIAVFSESESSDTDDGFTLVHRSKTDKNNKIGPETPQSPAASGYDSSYDSDSSFSPPIARASTPRPAMDAKPGATSRAAIDEKPVTDPHVPVESDDSRPGFIDGISDDDWSSVASPTKLEFEFI